jgi:hypothetical protein
MNKEGLKPGDVENPLCTGLGQENFLPQLPYNERSQKGEG